MSIWYGQNHVIILFYVLQYYSKYIQDKYLSVIQLTLNIHIVFENGCKKNSFGLLESRKDFLLDRPQLSYFFGKFLELAKMGLH